MGSLEGVRGVLREGSAGRVLLSVEGVELYDRIPRLRLYTHRQRPRTIVPEGGTSRATAAKVAAA